jgi:hypothetical protein
VPEPDDEVVKGNTPVLLEGDEALKFKFVVAQVLPFAIKSGSLDILLIPGHPPVPLFILSAVYLVPLSCT